MNRAASVVRIPLAMLLVVSILVLQARGSEPALAQHHIAEITEVMSGFNGDPNVQFVEVSLLAIYQNEVANTRLTAFNPDGTVAAVLLDPLGSNVGLLDTKILLGTAAFEAAAGISADFVFSAGILPAAGMVCWGAPGSSAPAPGTWSASDPNNYVDCVSYGGASFTGTNPMSPNPSSSGAGDDIQSLTRNVTSTGKVSNPWRNSDDATDFKLAGPSPTNGDSEVGVLDPNAPTATPTATALPPPVGGVSREVDSGTLPLDASEPSGHDGWLLAALAAGILLATAAAGGLAWAWRRSTDR